MSQTRVVVLLGLFHSPVNWDNWGGVVKSSKGSQQENMAVHEHKASLL